MEWEGYIVAYLSGHYMENLRMIKLQHHTSCVVCLFQGADSGTGYEDTLFSSLIHVTY